VNAMLFGSVKLGVVACFFIQLYVYFAKKNLSFMIMNHSTKNINVICRGNFLVLHVKNELKAILEK
jgi:hypothetical protein